MAWLRVSADLVASWITHNTITRISVTDARIGEFGHIEFWIEGDQVPDSDKVTALITENARTITFKKIE